MYFTYILRCADDTLYCGYTTDLERRIKSHNDGFGAKYTRSRRPVELVYFEGFSSKSLALKREYAIKKLHKKAKEQLIVKHAQNSKKTEEI
ncbi:MAG: GIY-YIG nuclease family protein [Lachnospiraceae bacterium]|nr:GIY-YIG nuclease family protein [Lachnospiraceae bacterium]